MLLSDFTGSVVGHRRGRLGDLLTLLRPLHSMKSLLLVPIAFVDASGWTLRELAEVGWAAAVFTVAAACVYVANDITDRDRDQHHPTKRLRPIAAGRMSVRFGRLCHAGLLILLGLLIGFAPGGPYWPVLVYLALNIAYRYVLKQIPLLDVGTIALGFVLRIVQGYVAIGATVSDWLLVTVFSLALLLLFGKRRYELLAAGPEHRPALRGYSVELTNQLLPLTGVLAMVAGLAYLATDAPFGPYRHMAVLLSAPFALFILFRYLQVLLVDGGGGDPVRTLLRDRVIVVLCLLWASALAVALVLARHPELL